MTATSADRLALQSLCILEGAVAVSRARRGISPLDEAAQAIRTLYEAEVDRAVRSDSSAYCSSGVDTGC